MRRESLYVRYGKRLFDVVLAASLLVALAPLLALLAALVLLLDGRPVLFRQTRVGRHGVPFELWKFRSMRSASDEAGFEPGSLARVSPLGRQLRRWKLDEIPQLVNVLRGEMSLVGPRPEVPAWVSVAADDFAPVLTARPGMTDRASLAFAAEESLLARASDPHALYRDVILPAKLAMARDYVRTHSFGTDLAILAETARQPFRSVMSNTCSPAT